MVAANKNLLALVRRQALRNEILAMRLRNRLVVPPALLPAVRKPR